MKQEYKVLGTLLGFVAGAAGIVVATDAMAGSPSTNTNPATAWVPANTTAYQTAINNPAYQQAIATATANQGTAFTFTTSETLAQTAAEDASTPSGTTAAAYGNSCASYYDPAYWSQGFVNSQNIPGKGYYMGGCGYSS